jgi:outer membrane protein assembly factor BamB
MSWTNVRARGSLLWLTGGLLLAGSGARLILGAPAAASWDQWRGPGRDGVIAGFRGPAAWPGQLERGWRVEVGLGHASPIVVDDAVYLFAREGEEEVARRLDLGTGKEIWKQRCPAPYVMNPAARGHGPGPKSTPLCDGTRLYTFGISGILSALDAATGKPLWRHDFRDEFPKTSPLYGAAASPLLDRGLLIVPIGGPDRGALVAFDPATGQARWRWTGDGPGYSSPMAITREGRRQVVVQMQKLCIGVDARDGKLLWSIPFATAFDQNIFTPVVVGERLVFGGVRQPTFAVTLRQDGDAWKAERAWETNQATFYMNTPVLSGGRLYGFSERQGGQLVALDAATGQLQWSGDARLATNAQLLDAGPVVLVLTTEADLLILKKDGAVLTQVARYHVADSPTWATPAIAGRRILVKDLSGVTEWRVPE